MIRERYASPNFDLVPLGSLTTLIQYGTSERATSDGKGVPVLRIPNLQADGWDLSDLKYLPLGPKEIAPYRLEKGDILFNRTNGSRDLVGKCEVFDSDGVWVFASYLIRLRINRTLALPEFVTSFLNTFWGRRQVEHVSRQILMSNINADEIRALRIPLPDLPQQQALITSLSNARDSRKEMLAQADHLLTSLDDFVLDLLGVRLPPASSHRPIYAVRLCDATAGKKLIPGYFHPERLGAIRAIENAYPDNHSATLLAIADFRRDQRQVQPGDDYVGLANVQSDTGERCESTDKEVEGTVFEFATRDVLFARLRPYLNKVYRAEHDGVCSPEFYVLRVRIGEDGKPRVVPDYLAAVLRSSLVLAQTRYMMTGNTHPRLANEDVVNLVVPVPPLPTQNAIANEVTRRREQARQLRADATKLWAEARSEFEVALLGPPRVRETRGSKQ